MAGPAKRPESTFVAAAGRAGACEWLGGTRPPGQLVTWVLGAVPAVLGLSGWNVHPQTAGLTGHARPERYPGRPKRTQELQKLTAPASRGRRAGWGVPGTAYHVTCTQFPPSVLRLSLSNCLCSFHTRRSVLRGTPGHTRPRHTGRRRCPCRCFG